jgi:diaminopimelate epimerase
MPPLPVIKAHAYGNDFLFVAAHDADAAGDDLAALARRLCHRHRGIGADGLASYRTTSAGAIMRLRNADGSPSEVSGNGVRCLATIVARGRGLVPGAEVCIETDAGEKRLTLCAIAHGRHTFRAAMGPPTDVRDVKVSIGGRATEAVALRVGNPQCVIVGGALTGERLALVGPALQRDPHFPEGVNVELAVPDGPDRVRILIWERGVGPTESSGTGSCAAAVACAHRGLVGRNVSVVAPGGMQNVAWEDSGLYLTGDAEVVLEGVWTG